MNRTQDHLPIVDVKEDVAILKNGDMAVIMETSAVNFGLLSANEQFAIIASFAGMLNSLSFSIQIVIRSKRLDITDYLKLLDSSYKQQTNPLLANMMLRYRTFIETTVRENEVLDKQFFVVISISYLELGITKSLDEASFKKALTLLYPRRDHIARQLARIGLKASQLSHNDIVRLFYDIYNFDPRNPTQVESPKPLAEQQPLTPLQVTQQATPEPKPMPRPIIPVQTPQPAAPQPQTQSAPLSASPLPARRNAPFVVEELGDEYMNVGR